MEFLQNKNRNPIEFELNFKSFEFRNEASSLYEFRTTLTYSSKTRDRNLLNSKPPNLPFEKYLEADSHANL